LCCAWRICVLASQRRARTFRDDSLEFRPWDSDEPPDFYYGDSTREYQDGGEADRVRGHHKNCPSFRFSNGCAPNRAPTLEWISPRYR